jgi:beta-phosphoglucomutase-like phosphatase (HAD superfamily)
VSVGAVSNSERAIVDANLQAIDESGLMRFVITLDDVVQPKPLVESYQRAASALGFPRKSVVAVEDSAGGLKSARSAGLRTLLLIGHAKRSPLHQAAEYGLLILHDLLPWWHQQAQSSDATQEQQWPRPPCRKPQALR